MSNTNIYTFYTFCDTLMCSICMVSGPVVRIPNHKIVSLLRVASQAAALGLKCSSWVGRRVKMVKDTRKDESLKREDRVVRW